MVSFTLLFLNNYIVFIYLFWNLSNVIKYTCLNNYFYIYDYLGEFLNLIIIIIHVYMNLGK